MQEVIIGELVGCFANGIPKGQSERESVFNGYVEGIGTIRERERDVAGGMGVIDGREDETLFWPGGHRQVETLFQKEDIGWGSRGTLGCSNLQGQRDREEDFRRGSSKHSAGQPFSRALQRNKPPSTPAVDLDSRLVSSAKYLFCDIAKEASQPLGYPEIRIDLQIAELFYMLPLKLVVLYPIGFAI
jgi:hypothetical protein